MREILFRGKRIDNGEWVEGFYCPAAFGWFPCRPAIVSKEDMDDGFWHPEEVDPSTVGQYTGKTDRNHKKVFEHDILQMYTILADGRCEKAGIVVVLFSVNDQAYVLCSSNNIHDMYDDFGNYGRSEYYEKIGNIHDNPELLEVSGDA